MAKRPALDLDSDDEIVVTSPIKRSKQVRIEDDDEEDVRVLSSDDSMEVDDDDSPEDEAINEERIRAEIQSQAQTKELGEIAEMGVITKVELINFMCHDNLTVNLGPQINFLTGHNGSGKSAVLTAITVALGAKAVVTGRGAGIRAFIKNGQDACRVTVTIKNKGFEAYREDLYGDSIVVERNVFRDGKVSGGYKIKSGKTNKTISTKRDDLDAILDHMNIQVDNPINVLSQDAARAFLTKSNAKAKYDFFLQGTQLAQLAEEYDLVRTQINTIQISLKQKETVLPELKDVIKEAKKKMDEITAVEKAEERLLTLEREMAWCLVVEKEHECQAKETEVQQSQERVKKAKLYVKQGTDTEKNLVEQVAALETIANEHQQSAGPTNDLLKDSERAMKAFKSEYRSLDSDRKELIQQITQDRLEIDGIDKAICDEQAKLNIDTSEEKARKLAVIQDLELNIEKIRHQFPRLEQELANENVERTRVEEEVNAADFQVERLKVELQNMQGGLKRLQDSQGGGPLGAYGRGLEHVMREINKRQWVGAKPIGPLGLFVKLRDPSWRDVVEANLGQTLSSFGVTRGEDVGTLRDVFRRCTQQARGVGFHVHNPQINVYTPDASKAADIDRADLSKKGYTTMMSVLEFSNEDVRGILVDRAFIERSPITRTRDEAVQLARKVGDGTNVYGQEPLYKAFTRQGTQTMNFVDKWDKPGLFTDDRTAEIENLKREMVEVEGRWQQAKQTRDELRAQLQQIKGQIREIQTNKILRLQNALKQRERKLADAHEANREEAPPNIAAMEERLEVKRAELQTSEGQLTDMQAAIERLQEQNRPLRDEIERLRNDIEDHGAKYRTYTGELATLQKKLTKATSDKKHYATKQIEEEERLERLAIELDELQNLVEAWTTDVKQVHPQRVEVPAQHTRDWLHKAIDGQQKIIDRQVRSSGLSMDEAQGAYDRAKKAYDSAKKEVTEMKSLLVALMAAFQLRSTKWNKFRRYIAVRAKVTFQQHLLVRGFLGRIIFDHEKGTLALRIQTDDLQTTQEGSRDKNPNQLSGGEKSFSTVALLLSLWDAVGCPIRCLDEFDVFMDAVVRRQTLNMMMDVAQRSDSTQYVLITPQDMSGVRTGPAVRIHKMRDPERLNNQSRLNFAVE